MKRARELRWRLFAAAVVLLAGVGTGLAESPGAANLYFDAEAIGSSPGAFIGATIEPQRKPATPSRLPAFDFSKTGSSFSKSGKIYSGGTADDDDSFGRVPVSGGSFGLETERKFNADKSIPSSSQMFDSDLDRREKKPFIGLSIEAPYASEDR